MAVISSSYDSNYTQEEISAHQFSEVEPEQLTPWQAAHREYREANGLSEVDESQSSDADDASLNEEEPSEEERDSETITEEESELDVTEYDEDGQEIEPADVQAEFDEFDDRLTPEERHRLIRRGTGLILLFLIPALVCLFYISPLCFLKTVEVDGNKVVTEEQILQSANLTLNQNIWPQYFDRSKDEAQLLKDQPRIKNVAVKLTSLNKLTIKITEYSQVAFISKKDQVYPVLSNGLVLKTAVEKTADYPLLVDMKNNQQIKTVLKAVESLSAANQKNITQVQATPSKANPDLLKLTLADGNQVIVRSSEMKEKMKYYAQVYAEMKKSNMTGVVDMEEGIYSTPYPAATTDSTATATSDSAASSTDSSTVAE